MPGLTFYALNTPSREWSPTEKGLIILRPSGMEKRDVCSKSFRENRLPAWPAMGGFQLSFRPA